MLLMPISKPRAPLGVPQLQWTVIPADMFLPQALAMIAWFCFVFFSAVRACLASVQSCLLLKFRELGAPRAALNQWGKTLVCKSPSFPGWAAAEPYSTWHFQGSLIGEDGALRLGMIHQLGPWEDVVRCARDLQGVMPVNKMGN